MAMNAISTSTPAVNVTTFPGVAVIAYVRNGADVTSGFFQMREYSKSSLVPKTFEGHGGVTGTTGTAQVWGHLVGLGPVNAIRISVNSGTFRAGGVVRLYGRR